MITKQESEIIQGIAMTLAAETDTEESFDYTDTFETTSRWGSPKLAKELAKRFGIKVSSGCYRSAFILSNVVVKISKSIHRMKELESEAQFIKRMRKDRKFGRHFPQTEVFKVGNAIIQIQEKVNMSHRGISWAMHDEVSDLGDKLGIEDIHSGNYGWKMGPNGKYPVFIDVDFRDSNISSPKKKRRSWFV